MSKTANLYIRIEPEVKKQAESIFAMLGIQASSAISMFYKQVILHGGLPFEVKVPEKEKPMVLRKLTEEETKSIIIGGINDAKEGHAKEASEVFDKLRKDNGL